ncbi:MAG: folate-binding protein YgfZ [Rhodospirillaceae bacterium]|jgi:tRNA-modifying protein YgfZ|nr:folate-binding protein YgfZ [Rhodospirillaceae bacterium]
MSQQFFAILAERGVIRITGEDAREFLQGLISNDINRVSPGQAIYAALLTPQGKYMFDFFVAEHDGALLLETERSRIAELIKRLNMYKLRAKADLQDVSDAWRVAAVWGEGSLEGFGLPGEPGATIARANGLAFTDPRLLDAGARLLLRSSDPLPEATDAGAEGYDDHRLALGLPDGSRDMILDKSILLESGFDELHGVDWNKGCYMGQELTARTKYRGLVKKRLVPVSIDGPLPASGTDVTADGKTVGEVRSGLGGKALALIRLEALENKTAAMRAGDATVTPHRPPWAEF